MSTTADVLAGRARWACEPADAMDFLRGLPDDAADVVFTSPPYTDARTYGVGADRDSAAWVRQTPTLGQRDAAAKGAAS